MQPANAVPLLVLEQSYHKYSFSMDEQYIIGYDAKRIVSNATGLGSYGRTLINALAPLVPQNKLLLYAPDSGNEALRTQIAQTSNVAYTYPKKAKLRLQKDLWRAHGIVKDLQRDGVQLFHGLSGELPRGIRKAGIRSVVTIHDLIFLAHPEYYHWIDTKLYARKFQRTCREADLIIAISERTKNDILRYSDLPAERIRLIYQSCGDYFATPVSAVTRSAVREKYHLPTRYLLNVGTVEARKNLLLAVQALHYLPEELKLVVVGRHTAYTRRVEKYIAAHHLQHRVLFLRGIPNQELPAIYQQAEVFVYPSYYEGFGIPIIEAIQSGLPVVACTGSCLEEAGGRASLYVAPDDAEGMGRAIQRLLVGAPEREASIVASRAYVRRFENQNVAAEVLAVYNELLN